tara:strand:- start:1221 stop:1862 length:642 start_codon:yes stop_codon:yes gene_type:complete
MVYSKRKGDADKVWCNDIVSYCVDKFTDRTTGGKNALVLDDHNYQSTLSLMDVDKNIEVYIAQHDDNMYKKMKTTVPSNVSLLINDECTVFNTMKNVVVDHADFCGTSKTVFPILRERFENGVYATKSILRVTVCQRGSRMKKDKFCDNLLCNIYDLVEDTDYAIKPLSVRQWCDIEGKGRDKDFPNKECLESVIYNYGKQMYTVICVVTRLL